ncbi:tetratricopeptide repeat protein [Polynucleobacter paneuropaeus]|nr:tetratricopeptide repeat protein [Polynucleobacter paneuropaeus]MBT8616789.1 tetratricopeptide repeat protein [Polynucleobacter paneuropaeus]MBT8618669.1 tetratricopeptide repeat protein [Polynucleobacter paneuropaeus]MBT8620952.1 tetratricopeptide repeat protein [Polynucleobacter paneuropaeus]MBT8626086.1 tetratricopeptide repeat protein [Polynucleobacter paneuropaeus]
MNIKISSKFQLAIRAFHEGDLQQAEHLLLNYLGEHQYHFDATHLLAIVYAHQDKYAEANKQYKNALKLNPSSISALSNWGACLNSLGQHEEALMALERALALDQTVAALHFNAANILCDLGKYNKACLYYEKALSINPKYFQAYNNCGKAFFSLGQSRKALDLYNKALALNGHFSEAWSNKGNSLNELGQYLEAILCHEKSLELNPDFPEAWNNKGNTLQALKRYQEALDCYNNAIQLKSDFVEAWSNKGNLLNELKAFSESLICYEKALSLDPSYAEAWSNKAITLQILKRYEEALDSYNNAIQLKPDFEEAWSNKGNLLVLLRRYEEAIHHYEKTIDINPDANWIFGALLDSKKKICFWDKSKEDIQKLVTKIHGGENVIDPFHFLALKDDASIQKVSAEIFAKGNINENSIFDTTPKKSENSKIKIAYISGDFRKHPTAQLIAELFELHDRDYYEILAFSLRGESKDSVMRSRIKNTVDHFLEVHNKSDEEIAQLAREYELDIAVDLGGYTDHARTGIFANRAAPIQVNYLVYPGTLGASYMDYIVADPVLIPEQSQKFFTEKVAYLPDTYQPNDRQRQIASKQFARSELGLPEQGFIFCCFNNNFKINPNVFDSWTRILAQVPRSVLWLRGGNQAAQENLIKEASKRGITADHLIFAARIDDHSEYLASYTLADMFLDTYPYNAHTTASDALWAGLPVLTLMGESFAARVAARLLNAIDLPELITHSQAEYESLAVELATHPEKLLQIKRKLQDNRLTKPLFDTPRYTKNIEAAYTQMYGRYQAGLPPDHLYI